MLHCCSTQWPFLNNKQNFISIMAFEILACVLLNTGPSSYAVKKKFMFSSCFIPLFVAHLQICMKLEWGFSML